MLIHAKCSMQLKVTQTYVTCQPTEPSLIYDFVMTKAEAEHSGQTANFVAIGNLL